MFLGRCNNVVLLDNFQGMSKHISSLFDFDRRASRRHMARLLRVVTLGANRWRVYSAFHKIFALRHEKGNSLHMVAFQRPFNKCGTDTGSVWKGARWPLVKELSTSVKVMQYDLTKSDLAKSGYRKLLFDTHAMTQLLEESGFTIQQAEVIVKILLNTTDSNMDIMYGDMVTKTQQEIMLQKIMSHIAAVKKDMIILEKSEFSALLEENDRIKVELAQVTMQLSDLMNKVSLDNKLDMNLEKSQVKEMKAEHEKKLLEARNHMLEMLAEQDRHVTQSKMKIDTEVAGLKTMLESHKLDSIKYLAGSVFTCLTVVLGFFRIWM
ncbi:LOW QUALITY PROTEIN: mitochondrial calcium uniporter regulator 1 [Neoarius graeffei]|uniref:LOW QUALITY PROTEIN: mitochondrial calcium uniporter regulator 1 n=1 Tax=Neoarius graeffei TaxID=443677 RepID=UPI00298C5222|nr:LOW QUALITY PROTEIN: mitochondrial calcium uniporter regulator 1 [Neoarius graeffei]